MAITCEQAERVQAVDGLVRKIVWAHSESTGIRFDDLYSLARDVLFTKAEQYSSDRGAFTTFAHRVVNNAILDLRRRPRRILYTDVLPRVAAPDPFANRKWLTMLCLRLEWDAMHVVYTALDLDDQNKLPAGRVKARRAIQTALLKEGMKYRDIEAAFVEIHRAITPKNRRRRRRR